jgi:hypothetical protein
VLQEKAEIKIEKMLQAFREHKQGEDKLLWIEKLWWITFLLLQ